MAAIHAACFPPEARWGADAMALQLGLPGAFGFIDARGGFVLARVAADEAEILTLAVMPAARRGGLARGLLRRAMQEAAEAGAASLFLEVAADNAAARALYADEGFCRVGQRLRYYPGGGDALVLRRMIDPPIIDPAEVTIS
jgi:ribosomal-protein-alanine N-acetyltransferase